MDTSKQIFTGYACHSAGEKLKLYEYEPQQIGQNDVEIEITHCGVCHSDVHFLDNFAGMSQYPMIAGHEIVGIIKEKGANVADFQLGDRVGLGTVVDCCLDFKNCKNCRNGNEQYCPKIQFVYNSPLPDNKVTYGGFQQKIRCSSNFLFKIPDNIESAQAAPLLCAGNTVYPPLARYGAGSIRKKVGVVGMGGLGHLAIQFASKMGAEVTVISTSDEKKQDAFKYGAHHFVNSQNKDEMSALTNHLDLILNTVSEIDDLSSLISMLNMEGVIVLLALNYNTKLPTLSMIFSKRITVTASFIASKQEGFDMLEFASRNDIKAEVQQMSMQEVNEGIKLLRENKARYRIVLTNN